MGLQRRGRAWWWTGVVLGCLTSACSSLLPDSHSTQGRGWTDFEHARQTFLSIRPFTSSRADVHGIGLEPFRNPSVTLLTYADLIQRFGTGNALRAEQLERGVRECLEAGARCTGYQLSQRELNNKRVGNFWLDLLNFRRETESEGWSFNGMVVFVDDLVVLTLHGGQPRIHEFSVSRNPLGPLQGMAERAVQNAVQP